MANPIIETGKHIIQDLKECPLCKEGKMEGKLINHTTPMWICDECPAILFEYKNDENTEDVVTYLERDKPMF